MAYDKAWNMPNAFWRPQSSYPASVVPPTGNPDGGTLVCLPPINQNWLPFIQGCLDQLTQPTAWQVADDDAMYDILSRVNRLKEMVGLSEACVSYQQRFTAGCGLEYSTDGGETWTVVPGWNENFPACNPPQTQLRLNANCNLQESFDAGATWPNVPGWASNFRDCTRLEVGPPPPQPFPPTLPPADQACAIATHLAQAVIRGSMQQAVNSINAADSLITFGVALLGLIPGVDLIVAGVLGGGAALFEYINAGRITAFNTAVADDGYFNDMACRIQAAIADVGYITPDNWPTVLAAIGSTPYSDGDVQFAVAEFAASLGFSGANELQQVGTLTTAVCSGCGNFCKRWGPDGTDFCNGDWVRVLSDANCGSCGSNEWGGLHGDGFWCLIIDLTLPATRTIGSFQLTYSGVDFEYFHVQFLDHPGGAVLLDITAASWTGTVAGVGAIRVNIQQNAMQPHITSIEVAGAGTNPWGADNCI